MSHVPASREKRKIDYKTENELAKEGGKWTGGREANQGILRHEKKRKIEVKVAELEDLLVDQNDLTTEQIQDKVNAYRKMLLEKEKLDGGGEGGDNDTEDQLDEFGRVIVKDSHQFAKLQNQVRNVEGFFLLTMANSRLPTN